MEVYKFKTKPYKHQLDEFLLTRDAKYWARFWDMGTGKSKIAIDEAAWLYDNGKIDTVLILSNKGSYDTWFDKQIPAHLPDHIPRFVTHWTSSGGKKHEQTYDQLFKVKGLRFLVMNIEALSLSDSPAMRLAQRLATFTRCLCVVDESSSIKNPKAHRTKNLLKLSKLFAYRRIMTGTPASNGPLNVYSQAEFLNPYLLGHSSYYSFRNEYCVLVDMKVRSPKGSLVEFKKITGFKNLENLKKVMHPWSSVIKKEDCLDLPPKIYETYTVELTDEQRRIYDDLKERSIAELSAESLVTAKLALTKVLRLQQVLCGYVPDEEGRCVEIDEKRTSALMEILEEASGKVIIWSRFITPIERIATAIKKDYEEASVVTYYGATEDRGAAVNRFQEGTARFFVGNPQTAGYGITLTAANTVIYYANSFDLEHRLQSEDRCHRIGQTRSVTYIDLVAKDTVDVKILAALRSKRKVQDMLLDTNGWKDLF